MKRSVRMQHSSRLCITHNRALTSFVHTHSQLPHSSTATIFRYTAKVHTTRVMHNRELCCILTLLFIF